MCYLGCMVININVAFAERRLTELDYCCLGFFLTWNPLFTDAVAANFHVLVNTYFLNFRLALLIVLRSLVHLIYLVIFSNFLVFNFRFLISDNNFLLHG